MSKTARRDGWDGELAGGLCRGLRGVRTRERERESVCGARVRRKEVHCGWVAGDWVGRRSWWTRWTGEEEEGEGESRKREVMLGVEMVNSWARAGSIWSTFEVQVVVGRGPVVEKMVRTRELWDAMVADCSRPRKRTRVFEVAEYQNGRIGLPGLFFGDCNDVGDGGLQPIRSRFRRTPEQCGWDSSGSQNRCQAIKEAVCK